ncbi:MAG: S8 family peptidase, partial [Alphaproteobacteria bacterium]
PALGAIHPESAWTAGATGAGIVVAVIDVGVDLSNADLAGRISPDSTDLTGPHSAFAQDTHSTIVSTIIAADFNNQFTVGVAYEATILAVRVDDGNSCATDCRFRNSDLVKGLDYATQHGAKIINLSLGALDPPPTTLTDAMQRAVDAGLVITAAAGNDGTDQPEYPARLASDTRFQGSIIAVGALNAAGTDLADFSNRAGDAANYYLAAPGEKIEGDCAAVSGGSSCLVGDGTSFAVPQVSGALALLLDAFPSLTGKQAVEILLVSAKDMGTPGTDTKFGRGALDIRHAFQPLGTLSVATPRGVVVLGDSTTSGAVTGSAFGDSLAAAGQSLSTVIYDGYQRRFTVGLGDLVQGSARRNPMAIAPMVQSSQTRVTTPDGRNLSLSVQARQPLQMLPNGVADPGEKTGFSSAAVSYTSGAMALDFWTGEAGSAPQFAAAPSDAFSRLAQSRLAARAAWRFGPWTISAEQGTGSDRQQPFFSYAPLAPRADGSSYIRGTANFGGEAWRASASVGELYE